MAQSPAILLGGADSSEIDVRPASNVSVGRVFLDPVSAKYVIAPRDLVAFEFASAYDSGTFRCLKENAADAISEGVTLALASTGYEEGAGPLKTVEASTTGSTYVIAELNPPPSLASNLRSVIKTSEFEALVDIPTGTPINTRGPTTGFTSALDPTNNYALHSLGSPTGGLLSTNFPLIYGTSFWAFAPLAVEERDIAVANIDPPGYVRFFFAIPAGTQIRFESQVLEAV